MTDPPPPALQGARIPYPRRVYRPGPRAPGASADSRQFHLSIIGELPPVPGIGVYRHARSPCSAVAITVTAGGHAESLAGLAGQPGEPGTHRMSVSGLPGQASRGESAGP